MLPYNLLIIYIVLAVVYSSHYVLLLSLIAVQKSPSTGSLQSVEWNGGIKLIFMILVHVELVEFVLCLGIFFSVTLIDITRVVCCVFPRLRFSNTAV